MTKKNLPADYWRAKSDERRNFISKNKCPNRTKCRECPYSGEYPFCAQRKPITCVKEKEEEESSQGWNKGYIQRD